MANIKTKDGLFYGRVKKCTIIGQSYDEIKTKIYCYDQDGYLISYQFNDDFRRISTTYKYNSKKQLVEECINGDYNSLSFVKYYYDSFGNVIEEIQIDSENEIELRNVYEYNGDGKKISYKKYLGDGSLQRNDTYYYDINGRLIKETSYEGYSVIIYEYNSNNNLIERRSYENGELVRKEKYSYDDNNNKIEEIVYQAGKKWTTKNVYNNKNQLVEIFQYEPNDELGSKYTLNYDDMGNEISHEYYSCYSNKVTSTEKTTIEYY